MWRSARPRSRLSSSPRSAPFYLRSSIKRRFKGNLSGNEVHYKNSLTILAENMLCSKLHCQKGFELFSFDIRSPPGPLLVVWWTDGSNAKLIAPIPSQWLQYQANGSDFKPMTAMPSQWLQRVPSPQSWPLVVVYI